MPEPPGGARHSLLTDTRMVAACLCLFALSAHLGGVASYVGGAALAGAAAAVVVSLSRSAAPHAVLGLGAWTGWMAGWACIATAAGMALGIAYRHASELSVWPESFTGFAVVAAAIGATEELVYRGYVQGRLAAWGAPIAIVGAAFAHTAYKAALFLGGPSGAHAHYLFAALVTFVGGLALGALRWWTWSIVPPVAFHVAFDIVVYGDRAEAPWWVWA
ncbi:MAG: CPBP family intramembrane glutamic endopeptidase [bacterium]